MDVNFPNNPQINDVFTKGDRSWRWTGVYWRAFSTTVGYTGSKGDQGEQGRSLTIKGTLPTVESLPNDSSDLPGDAYFIESTGELWVWDGENYINAGVIRGFTGSRGATGTSVRIVGSIATSSSLPIPYEGEIGDGYLVQDTGELWIWDGSSWGSIGKITGDVGPTGFAGSQGDPGYTGSQGAVGYTGSLGGAIYEFSVVGSAYKVQGYAADFPALNVLRGQQYYFDFSAIDSGNSIALRLETGSTAAVPGTLGNDADTGTSGNIVSYRVPFDAPNVIYYQGTMEPTWVGVINVFDQVGYTGSAGFTGSFGFTGSRGDLGYTGSQGVGFTGSQGDPGTSIRIIGSVQSVQDLPNDSSGTPGDGYVIIDTGELYVWDGSNWVNAGRIVGYTGSQGPPDGYTGSKGDPGVAATFTTRAYLGDGSTTAYDITAGNSEQTVLVFLNGVNQRPTDDYTVSGGQLLFTSPPTLNELIVIREMPQAATGFTGSLGFTGSRGATGTSVRIVGSVSTAQDLPIPHTGDIGDGYLVQDSGELWIWDGSSWGSIGKITGDVGPSGFTGSAGEGILEAEIVGDDLVITYEDSTKENLGRVVGFTGSKGLGLDPWIRITSNYTATSGNRIIADTRGGSFTITLPTNPEIGSYVVLTDGGDWSSNLLILDSGIYEVEGYTGGVDFDIGGVTTELLFDGVMWQVTATLGAEGPPGLGVPQGGTAGQVLTKLSGDDYDATWQDPSGGNLGSLDITGSVISTTDSADVSIDRNLRVNGDIIPETDSVFDLGSTTNKWRSLYVSSDTIYINEIPISVDQNGRLLVSGQLPEASVASLADISDVVVAGATVGQVLGYTGSNWTATTVGGGGGGADSYVKTYFWEGGLLENVSLKRFYIHVASTLEKITVNLGAAGLTQSTIQIKRNDQVLNSIVIPANTVYLVETVSYQLAVNDYLTVDITQSSSAANLYVTFVYRE